MNYGETTSNTNICQPCNPSSIHTHTHIHIRHTGTDPHETRTQFKVKLSAAQEMFSSDITSLVPGVMLRPEINWESIQQYRDDETGSYKRHVIGTFFMPLSQSEPGRFSGGTMQQTGTVKDTVSFAASYSPTNVYSTNPPTYEHHIWPSETAHTHFPFLARWINLAKISSVCVIPSSFCRATRALSFPHNNFFF